MATETDILIDDDTIFFEDNKNNPLNNIDPNTLMLVDELFNNLNEKLKINIQLILSKNNVNTSNILKDLSKSLNDKINEVNDTASYDLLYNLVTDNVLDEHKAKSNIAFKNEFEVLKDVTKIFNEKIKAYLALDNYQDCMVRLSTITNLYENSVNNHDIKILEVRDYYDTLVYELSTQYKLHSNIAIYMDVKKIVDEHRGIINSTLNLALKELKNFHCDSIINIKDKVVDTISNYQEDIYNNKLLN